VHHARHIALVSRHSDPDHHPALSLPRVLTRRTVFAGVDSINPM
jgi:hypothetical protein